MNSNPSVAIIVLNWNGLHDTIECLESLKAISYDNYKIIVVDNGSRENEGGVLKERFAHITLIQNTVNRGFAGGNNDGMDHALAQGFDYVVNLNNDCAVDKDWLSHLMKDISEQQADFASSMIMFYDEKDVVFSDEDVLFPDGSGISINRYKTSVAVVGVPRTIFAACGAGSVYSRECLNAVKLKDKEYFDELYFAFYEDIDLGIRLSAKSFKGIVSPKAVIYHKHSRTAGRFSAFKAFHSEKNRILNVLLNYPWYLIPLTALYFWAKLVIGFISSFSGKENKGARYRKNISIFQLMGTFAKARMWVLGHPGEILKDRRQRAAKGMVHKNILHHFHWSMLDFLK